VIVFVAHMRHSRIVGSNVMYSMCYFENNPSKIPSSFGSFSGYP
jgi:hypothetical protein